jgi:hypothetical protein
LLGTAQAAKPPSLKQLKIILPTVFLLLVLVVFLTFYLKTDPLAPRYLSVRAQPTGPFDSESYNWRNSIPFYGGKVWIWAVANQTNRNQYLYDLARGKVLDELINGTVAFANKDQTKILCTGTGRRMTPLKERFLDLIENITGHPQATSANREDCYWILDLKSHFTHPARQLANPGYNSGSPWRPSPDFRFGYQIPEQTPAEGKSFLLCDLDQESITNVKFAGEIQGWWDDHTLLAKDSLKNLVLYDVLKDKTADLFTHDFLQRRFIELKISDDPADLTALFYWNGHGFDFYVSGKFAYSPPGNNSYLLKIERSGPSLQLVQRYFSNEWLGRFDLGGNLYLYPGVRGSYGGNGNSDDAVHVRDVTSNIERILVPPDNSGHYSIPRFCDSSVIYHRDGHLWRVDLNGSNNTRLFAPAAQK